MANLRVTVMLRSRTVISSKGKQSTCKILPCRHYRRDHFRLHKCRKIRDFNVDFSLVWCSNYYFKSKSLFKRFQFKIIFKIVILYKVGLCYRLTFHFASHCRLYLFAFNFQHQQFLKCTVVEPASTRSSNELTTQWYAVRTSYRKRVTVSNVSSLMLISLSGALQPSALCQNLAGSRLQQMP